MLNLKQLASLICILTFIQVSFAQLGFSHEIGVIAGPVQFRSDFGQRLNEKNNFGNSGYGIGIVHYINFAYSSDCNCYTTYTYFNDHFKLRNEISYNKTQLEHYGEWVAPYRTTPEANQLRAHTGTAENFDIGTQIEFFPRSIRDFQGFAYTDLSHQINNLDILKSLINRSNNSLSQNIIIKKYLSGNQVERIIRF